MSQGAWDESNPNRDPDQPTAQPPRSTTGRKVLVAVLAVGGLLVLACCGCFAWFVMQTQRNTSEDPEVVRQRLQDVVEIEIPDQYNPLVTTAMDLVVFRMRLFVFETADGDGQLLLIEANRPLAEMRSGIEPQMRQAIPQEGQQPRELTITESEERQFEIQGQNVSFTFAKGTDANSGEEFRQVVGAFPGKDGSVLLLLQVKEEAYDEEQVVQMIESIE